MVDVKRLYKNANTGDYQPMIEAFGTIVLQIDEDDYQGDSWVLYRDFNYGNNFDVPGFKIGYLEFGWGSCSGCDALQACDSLDEIQELADELEQSIKWFDTEEEALDWFINHDWEGDWSGNNFAKKAFVEMARAYLKWKVEQRAYYKNLFS